MCGNIKSILSKPIYGIAAGAFAMEVLIEECQEIPLMRSQYYVGNGLVPSGNGAMHAPDLTQVYVASQGQSELSIESVKTTSM